MMSPSLQSYMKSLEFSNEDGSNFLHPTIIADNAKAPPARALVSTGTASVEALDRFKLRKCLKSTQYQSTTPSRDASMKRDSIPPNTHLRLQSSITKSSTVGYSSAGIENDDKSENFDGSNNHLVDLKATDNNSNEMDGVLPPQLPQRRISGDATTSGALATTEPPVNAPYSSNPLEYELNEKILDLHAKMVANANNESFASTSIGPTNTSAKQQSHSSSLSTGLLLGTKAATSLLEEEKEEEEEATAELVGNARQTTETKRSSSSEINNMLPPSLPQRKISDDTSRLGGGHFGPNKPTVGNQGSGTTKQNSNSFVTFFKPSTAPLVGTKTTTSLIEEEDLMIHELEKMTEQFVEKMRVTDSTHIAPPHLPQRKVTPPMLLGQKGY